MKHQHFSEWEAGAKTKWIIEFSKDHQDPQKKPACSFYIPSPPGTHDREANLWIDTKSLDKVKENYGEFLEEITKLCSLVEKDCRENIEEILKSREEIKAVDSSISMLGEIIRKFNEMLKHFRTKSDEPPKTPPSTPR